MERWTELALVSHEIGGALTPARNAIHLLRSDPPRGMDSRQERLLEMIARSLERTDRVLGNLSSIALPEDYQEKIETCHPHAWLHEWLQPFTNEAVTRNLRLDLDVADGMLAFPTEFFLMEQVLGNLISNAIKFTPAGGQVRVSAAASRGTVMPGRMLLLAGGFGFRPRFVQIVVEDSGIGLCEETRRRLFQPFYRGAEAQKHAGTGLGLTVAHRLVRMLHGDLRADDAEVGARFVLTLPADVATRQLAASVDSLYSTLRQELPQAQRNLLVTRLSGDAPSAAVDQLMQRFAERHALRVWKVAPTTWVALSDLPVRALYRNLAQMLAFEAEAVQQGLRVQVRRAGRGAPVDELVLQTVVRCRRTIPASVLQGQQANSQTEVA